MYVRPSESVVHVLWHMFGSFVLLRALDAVVATAAAEEMAEAFAVPLEAVVAFEAESFGCSAEKSSARQLVSIQHVDGSNDHLVNGHIPACRRLSEAADTDPTIDRIVYTPMSIETQLARPIQLFLPSMIFARACHTNKLQGTLMRICS